MITIHRHPDYSKNFDRPSKDPDVYRCVICGRPCPEPKYMLHEHNGGGDAVTEQEAAILDEAGDMGMQPIGADCLNKHPELKPYVQEQKPITTKKTIKTNDWKKLYFDLYRAAHGEGASDQEVMIDAYRRFDLLKLSSK